MTNENIIGGTVAVAATNSNTSAATTTSLDHSLPGSKHADRQHLDEDVALVQEEEKMMVEDEEVTSIESNGDHHAVEDTMLTVALVQSVVEKDPSSPLKQRLRKRPRMSGQDIDHSQDSQISTKSIKIEDTCSRSNTHHTPRPPASSKRRKQTKASNTTEPPPPSSSCVPNPLAQPIQSADDDDDNGDNIQPDPQQSSISASQVVDNCFTVPCPLPAAAAAAAAAVTSKSSDDCGDNEEDKTSNINILSSKKVVNFDDSAAGVTALSGSTFSRPRGFSIDLDLGLDFGDDHTSGSDGPSGSRSRTFSFECFAFGINADEPLPPLDQANTSSTTSRPRGDSIIFDPASFQDGGIHEMTALERARAPSIDQTLSSSPPAKPSKTNKANKPKKPKAKSTKSTKVKNTSNKAPATVTSTSKVDTKPPPPPPEGHIGLTAAGVGNGSTQLAMELLNKDGRIGIYLPEARRARIARFHAKRSKRIWRKRIKYDCRKKLADSRPRIKGRFVKRSDMDE